MSTFNFREDENCGAKSCIRCAYYSNRICVVTNSHITGCVVISTCDAFLNYKEEILLEQDQQTKEYLVRDSNNITYKFMNRQDAIQAEIKLRLDQTPISKKGNKIIVHGKVLTVSEYETIANEIKKEINQ